jgi:hypothetical protein
MRELGVIVQVVGLALCFITIFFLSGHQEAAFRYMGF